MGKEATSQQRQYLGALCAQAGLDDEGRKALVGEFTNGRKERVRDLTSAEASTLIRNLRKATGAKEDPRQKRKRKIIHYARLIGWVTPAGKADMDRINAWCSKSGMFHKALDDHSTQELNGLISQFEQVFKSYLNKV